MSAEFACGDVCTRNTRALFSVPGWNHTKFMDCRGDKHVVTKRLRPTFVTLPSMATQTAARRDVFSPFLLCKYVRSDVSFSLHQYIHIISTSQACLLVRELHHAAAASQPPTSVSSPDEPCDHVLTHVDRHCSPGYSEIFGLPVHILLASGWWCHSASSVHRVWSSHWSLFVSEPMCRLVTWGACVSLQQCTPASRTSLIRGSNFRC